MFEFGSTKSQRQVITANHDVNAKIENKKKWGKNTKNWFFTVVRPPRIESPLPPSTYELLVNFFPSILWERKNAFSSSWWLGEPSHTILMVQPLFFVCLLVCWISNPSLYPCSMVSCPYRTYFMSLYFILVCTLWSCLTLKLAMHPSPPTAYVHKMTHKNKW